MVISKKPWFHSLVFFFSCVFYDLTCSPSSVYKGHHVSMKCRVRLIFSIVTVCCSVLFCSGALTRRRASLCLTQRAMWWSFSQKNRRLAWAESTTLHAERLSSRAPRVWRCSLNFVLSAPSHVRWKLRLREKMSLRVRYHHHKIKRESEAEIECGRVVERL